MHENILELEAHFESKLSLIEWLDEENWIKSMCIKYIMYIFSTAIGPHVCDSLHITKLEKNEKIIQCPPIKSYHFLKVMVFPPKKKVHYAFIAHEIQKNTFFEWIFKQKL